MRRGAKGFTLLELLVVVIILGVLATLGLTQYTASVEKSRGAEARSILGQLRTLCAAKWVEFANVSECTNANLGVTNLTGDIPSVCNTTHYFNYSVLPSADSVVFTANRCSTGGKTPNLPASITSGSRILNLTCNYSSGTTDWKSSWIY